MDQELNTSHKSESSKEVQTEITEGDSSLVSPQEYAPLFPEGGLKANLTILGSFLGLIGTLGFVNATGVIQQYIAENIVQNSSQSSIGWIFSVYNFMAFGMTLISGPVFDRVGAKIPLVAGIIMQICGFISLSFCHKVWQFVLGYGILAGLGASFTFAPYVGVISHHFLAKRASAIGISYVGGALGGIIFPLVFLSLFPKVGYGWTIRIGTFMTLFFHIMGFLLVSDRTKEIQQSALKKEKKEQHIITEIIRSIDFGVFKDKVYSCLVLALLGNGFAFLISLTYIPSYAVANGMENSKAYLLLVVFNAMSIPGRLIPAYLADKYGRFNILCFVASLSTLAFCVIWVPPPIGHTAVGIYLFSGFYGFTSGSILSLAPACIGQICETKDFGKRYGTAYFALSFGDLIGIPIGGAIIGGGSSVKGFDNLVIFITVLSAAGTVGAFTARYLYGGFNMVKV